MSNEPSHDPRPSKETAGPEPSADLVARARTGDAEALEELMREHMPALRGFVRLRLGRALRSREESVDLVQSIVGDALADMKRFEYRGPESFRHWLMQRAENKIRTRGRFWGRAKRAAGREVGQSETGRDGDGVGDLREVASGFTPSRNAASREELERVEAAFQELSEDDRRVILLSRVAGLDHAAVAAEMGRTPLATRSLLSRALAKLAARLEATE
ncbi:RNA polymerase sigma factor CnrH [Planctomycetes bacterium Poly30]|uniref:RNA polymerase sigma factor CnrH n=1 Tax=Saltatorellus ferox TaxID=2528018 RepID=A0A518ELK9_9BACT|nr:RNA polymerase sigma factor CnrH [Planctomycetes bacterium Poly30]